MNNFNTVFTIVKDHCKQNGTIKGLAHLRKIAAETGLPMDRLHFYLDCLNSIGVIQYNSGDKEILLTDKGKNTHQVFSLAENA